MKSHSQTSGGLFASASLTEHLLRGAIGIALLYWVGRHPDEIALSVAAGIGALLAFRGCPVCWTIGLVSTMRDKALQLRAKLGRR